MFFMFASPSDLQHAAGGDWTRPAGVPHHHHQCVVLPGSGQHHHLPLRVPPPLPAFARVPRLPPPAVSLTPPNPTPRTEPTRLQQTNPTNRIDLTPQTEPNRTEPTPRTEPKNMTPQTHGTRPHDPKPRTRPHGFLHSCSFTIIADRRDETLTSVSGFNKNKFKY